MERNLQCLVLSWENLGFESSAQPEKSYFSAAYITFFFSLRSPEGQLIKYDLLLVG